jgi:hypothetical protein
MPSWQPERFWHPVHVMSWPSEERWSLVGRTTVGAVESLLTSPCFRKGLESCRRHGARGVPSLFVYRDEPGWDAGLVPRSLS